MLSQDVLKIADRWWARDFACEADDLRPSSTRVQEHAGSMVGATGIWILVVGTHPLVSMPKSAMELMASRAAGWSQSLVEDPSALAMELQPLPVKKIIGPAFIGYGTALTLDLSGAGDARELTRADKDAVARLRDTCGDEEWDHGGSDPNVVPTFGRFNDLGEILALAGYRTWGGEIAHISIVSTPSERGHGFGAQAVACAARHALDSGLLPQYRTLASNVPSMAVARSLGFESYGYSVFVRLATE